MTRCPVCNRPEIDPMTLNSVPVDRSRCYQHETGNDKRCKPQRKPSRKDKP